MAASEETLERYARYRESPWDFLSECVYTHDEVDADNPIKLFPSNLVYLFFVVQMWRYNKKIAIPKSRRMTVSWTFIGLAVWDCIFHKGRSWAFVSKKEEDSKELVERAQFIIKNIPPAMIPSELIPKMKNDQMQSSPPAIVFEELHSKIQGFPQGANQLRQRGFSGIFEDECAFWESAEEAYASAEPTIKGGGRMVMVSSRATEDGGFFKRIVFDQLDSKDGRFPEIPPVAPKIPMEGIEVWKNPRNGFLVIDLHYTANPDKRGIEFREGLKKNLPVRRYRMEYEKSWETFEGKPVYEDFNEHIHVTKVKPKVDPNLPLLLGWDSSGLTPACIICQLQEETLYVIREIMGTDIATSVGARKFVPYTKQQILLHFPQITEVEKQTISFFDPAGVKKNEVTEETYVAELIKNGFKQIRPGPMGFKKRIEAVVEWLTGMSKGKPKLQIYEQDCPVFVAGMKGGYRYSDNFSSIEPNKPEALKNIFSHLQDGFQYLCGGFRSYKGENYNFNVPTPHYGFQKDSTLTTESAMPTISRRFYGKETRG